MIRLRATVSFGRAQQVFDLEGAGIVIGRDPEATLVLPMDWVEERQVLIEADLNGGVRVRPGGGGAGSGGGERVERGGGQVMVNTELLSGGGMYVPRGTAFEVRILAPGGDAVVVTMEPLAPVVAVAERHGRWSRAELIAGGCVLVGAVAMGGYLLMSGSGGESTRGGPVGLARVEGVVGVAEREALIDAAAKAVAQGDVTLARTTLDRAMAAGASGPVVDALAAAIRSGVGATQPSTVPSGPAAAVVPAAVVEAGVDFEGRRVTVAERDAVLRQREEAKAKDEAAQQRAEQDRRESAEREEAAAREKAEQEQRSLLAAAEQDLKEGKDAKLTELGRGAIGAAKDAVRARLGRAELTFPDDSDDRVVVVFRGGQYMIRGFADEWNQGRIPVRLFYLARVQPAGIDKWTVLGVELLK